MWERTVLIIVVVLASACAVLPAEEAAPAAAGTDGESAVSSGADQSLTPAVVAPAPAEGAAAASDESAPISWVGDGFSPASPASDPRSSVVPTGAFQYTYPNVVPAGTNGVQPELSLSYNSAGGIDMLGVGFALTGLPTIERDPTWPIAFTSSDHYTYRGEKLSYIGDGYFHPEREAYERISAFATDSEAASTSNPNTPTSHWRIERKDGSRLYFGSTANSRINAVGHGGIPRLWALSRYEDANGNYYAVQYSEDTTNGDYHPTKVIYTQGNGSASYKAVRFGYEARTDHWRTYAPTLVDTGQRLKWITVRAGVDSDGDGGYIVRKYRIDYEYSASTGRSRVVAIQELGTGATGALPAVTFAYQNALSTFEMEGTGIWSPAGAGSVRMTGDFDGDGKTDLLQYVSGTGWRVLRSTGDAFEVEDWSTAELGDVQKTGDFNGDGRTDLMQHFFLDGWHVMLSEGDSFAASTHWSGAINNGSEVTGDFDGDGRSDFLQYFAFTWHVWLSNGSTFTDSSWSGLAWSGDAVVGDFNGDGMTDFTRCLSDNWHVALSTGSEFADEVWSDAGHCPAVLTGDFNGDGKSDLMRYVDGEGWFGSISTGTAFEDPILWTSQGQTGTEMIGDFNGDGRTDVIQYAGSGVGWRVLLATGHSFTDSVWTGAGSSGYPTVGDFNGDG